MKRLLMLLALLAASPAIAQSWSGTATSSAVEVTAGFVTGLSVVVTAGAANAGVVVSVSVIDANGAYGTAFQEGPFSFQAAQVMTLPITETVAADAPNGTYTVVISANDVQGNLLFKNSNAVTFQVIGGVAASTPAAPATPTCFPPLATNVRMTLTPPMWTDWLAASNPTWLFTWFCPSSDPSGYTGYSLTGYRSELLPNWAALPSLSLSALVTLWKANTFNDPELLPAANAQLLATTPAPLKTTSTTAYYVIQQPDKYVAIPVGNVPLGTACIASQSVDGMYGVPAASVTWYGSVKPVAVVAPCG